jgi:hypothetical protein
VTWGRWYAAKSYMMSTLWVSPLVAVVLAQLTYRVRIDFGAIPGFTPIELHRCSRPCDSGAIRIRFIRP